ncbi:MAG: lysylphosphatidylglycerol synthase transmembrane domain-containing protein [Candidatus Bathyarchaeia archaeon]
MEPTIKRPYQSKTMLIILAVGLVAFLLYIFLYVNPAQIAQILSQTNLLIYSTAFIVYFINTVFSSLVWYRLLNSLKVKISKRKAFLYTWVGLFFEATIPQLGWSAEVSKTYMLTRDTKSDTGKVGASVVFQKIFNMTLTVVMLSIGLGLVLFSYQLPFLSAFAITLVLFLAILSLAIVYYVSLKPSATNTLLGLAIKIIKFLRKSWNPDSFLSKAGTLLDNFHFGIKQLKTKPKALVVPLIFSLISFFFEVTVFFIVFAALGQPLRVDAIFIVFTLTGVLQTIGIALGFPELVMALTLEALSINPEVAVSVALLTRAVNLWFRLIVSYGALQLAGARIIGKNIRKVQKIETQPTE